MALIEVNLHKPAIIEERPGTGGSTDRARTAGKRSDSDSGGRAVKLVGLLALVVGIGLLAARLRGGGDTGVRAGAEVGSMDETDESEGGSGGAGKVVGALALVVATASVALAVAKRRR
ncbi:hypothetical protein NGM10_06795 [Halorussus salilacus]|uniref:hypothetical protein n=1 Tax=Halorussus salilacus TaxID=2953750 RepID=UPI00209FCDEE|nr:hypothetical protein [Halorussus salilacus]USZ69435.1 hypothetical protein NGM10_06795 [Halorussus salilacus]